MAQSLITQQLEQLDTQALEQSWDELRRQYDAYLQLPDERALWSWWVPGSSAEPTDVLRIFHGLLHFVFDEILRNVHLLTALFVLSLFAAILHVLHQSFANPRVAAIANLVTMMALFSLAVHSLYVSLEYAAAAVQRMSDFMLAIFPLFMMLLATLGNLLSAAMMEPVLMAMTQLVGRLISQFIFPLILFAALLHMVSAMHEQLKFTRLAQLLTTIGMTVMTVTFTVFMAVLSFQGAFVATADGLAVRAAKFVAGNFVPVVGRMFADATDTVLGASLVVKNTVGLVGLLIVFLLCAFPALKVLVIAFIYKLAAALLQPLGDSSFGTVLETIGNSLLYVFGAVAALGLMFFFTLTVIISLGNISLMVR